MNKEEIQDILEELHLVRPEILQPKAKKLFEAIMSIADERDEFKHIIDELEKWLEYQDEHTIQQNNYYRVLNKLQELKGSDKNDRRNMETHKRL